MNLGIINNDPISLTQNNDESDDQFNIWDDDTTDSHMKARLSKISKKEQLDELDFLNLCKIRCHQFTL